VFDEVILIQGLMFSGEYLQAQVAFHQVTIPHQGPGFHCLLTTMANLRLFYG